MSFQINIDLDHDQKRFGAEWIDALESGDYEQAQKALKVHLESEDYGFCCLGVACEIYPGTKWDHSDGWQAYMEEFIPDPDTDGYVDEEHYTSASELPYGLRNKIGMDSNFQRVLIETNDSGASFKVIANLLRVAAGFPQTGEKALTMWQRNYGGRL